MYLKSRAGGVWLFAVAVASVVVFKDVARIELFDVGRVLGAMARSRDVNVRRRWGKLSVPFYVMFDIAVMIAVFFLCMMMFDRQITREALRIELPLRSVCVFVALVFFNTYRTAWSRAMTSNYFMLLFACLFGTAIGTVAIYYAPIESLHKHLKSITIVYSVLLFVSLSAIRLLRGFVRDIFYQIDSARLKSNPEVSRILVYGAGLRYRAYRRELVRNAANNKKIVVGLIDDDLILRGQYIGGVKIYGTLLSAPDIIKRLNVDTVVIACNLSNSRKEIAVQTLSVANVEIDTAVMADTNPAIGTFTDLSTNITGFEMTQNMPMKITGDRLKIIGDSQFAGIYFAPVLESGKINSDETTWIKVDKIFKNSPKELSFIIPSHLVPDSNYFVIIRTFGGRGNKANKTLKSAIGTNPVKINVA
jgi:hypothetical protein